MESYLTSRTSGRVEWSRMICEERFCGEMVEKVPSVQEKTKARRCGVAGQGFPPAQEGREHPRLAPPLPGLVLERQVIALEGREPFACCGQRGSVCPVLKGLVPTAL